MLKSSKLEVKRVDTAGLNIDSFLKPKDGGVDSFQFVFEGMADEKFLTKLARLIKQERETKNAESTTQKRTD